jgi:hypothetical protein
VGYIMEKRTIHGTIRVERISIPDGFFPKRGYSRGKPTCISFCPFSVQSPKGIWARMEKLKTFLTAVVLALGLIGSLWLIVYVCHIFRRPVTP